MRSRYWPRRAVRCLCASASAIVLTVFVVPFASALQLHRVTGFPSDCASGGTEGGGVVPGFGRYPDNLQATGGALWFVCPKGLVRLPLSGPVTGPFPLPKDPTLETTHPSPIDPSGIQSMAAAPDGSLWFTNGYGLICHMAASGHRRCAHTPDREREHGKRYTYSGGLVEGEEGDMWLLQSVAASTHDLIGGEGTILRVTPSFSFTEYPHEVTSLIRAASGNLWFGADSPTIPAGLVGYITATGEVTTFPLVPEAGGSPGPVLALANGMTYFVTGSSANRIVRVMPNGSQSVLISAHTQLLAVATPDESVWVFAQSAKAGTGFHYYKPGSFYRIAPDGTITRFPLSGRFRVENIGVGPDGQIWAKTWGYTERQSRLVSITATGQIVTHASYNWRQELFSLTATPAAMWMAISQNGTRTGASTGTLYRIMGTP